LTCDNNDRPVRKSFNRRCCPTPRFLLLRQGVTQPSTVGRIEAGPFPRKPHDGFDGIIVRIELSDAITVRKVVKEKRRHRRRIYEGNTHHESSESSLFILRKICCKSSCCVGFVGSKGRRVTPG